MVLHSFVALMLCLTLVGCGDKEASSPAVQTGAAPVPAKAIAPAPPAASEQPPTVAHTTKAPAGLSPEEEARAAAAHAEHLAAEGHIAPVDCPLRAAGIDPHGVKPFKEVDAYIAFLERADRATWQRPDAVVEALDLAGDETVVDVGAGSGYFAFRIAAKVPEGQVVALDVEPEMVRHVHHRTMTDGIENVRAVVVPSDDPSVPADADVVLLCDVLHHVQARDAWLKKLSQSLRPEARVVVIEFKEGDLPEGPPAALKLSRDQLVGMFEGIGMKLVDERPTLLPYQSFLVFEQPQPQD